MKRLSLEEKERLRGKAKSAKFGDFRDYLPNRDGATTKRLVVRRLSQDEVALNARRLHVRGWP